MPIRVQCNGCKTALAVKDHLAGKRVRCPKCQAPIAVPETGAAPPAPPTPPAASGPPKPAAAPKGTGVKAPVARPTRPLKAKASSAPKIDIEAEALAALRDDPAESHGTNGNGSATNGATANGAPAAGAPIKFPCDYCEAEIEFPADMAGKRAQCPECRQLIKVPVPKVEKPKDWRTVETKGPSLALANQPEKLNDAWGTETKGKVSQSALLEAGVIQKPKKPSIGLEGWIERGVKGGLLAIVIGGAGLGVWKLYSSASAQRKIEDAPRTISDKLPPVVQGEFHILVADLALRQPKSGDKAREIFTAAWQRNPPPAEPRDKIDRDYFLIRLAKAQAKLGGNEYDVASRDRFAWNLEVFDDVDRTIKKIESPDARVHAVREMAAIFADKGKPELTTSLANSVATAAPLAQALHLSLLWADPAKQKDAMKIKPFPDAGKSVDLIARCGYAEGLARQDKTDEALKLAQAPGQTSHKIQALLAVAQYLALDPSAERNAKIKEACDAVTKHLEREPKTPLSPWLQVEHVRLLARADAEAAKAIAKDLPTACKRRAQAEIAMALVEKSPSSTDAASIIRELDKEGPGRALAWISFAQAKSRDQQTFSFTPEEPDEELLQPVFRLVESLPARP
jgi:predicted Zn finger-like uncharacterized protein